MYIIALGYFLKKINKFLSFYFFIFFLLFKQIFVQSILLISKTQLQHLDFEQITQIIQISNRANKNMANQLQTLLSGAYFSALGFQSAENTTIPSLLRKINPNGGTAMRDSLIQGNTLMLKLNQLLKQMGTDSLFNFVHVILTDGVDQHSKSSLQDAAKMMILIGKLIPVKTLKIIFIGVGVNENAQAQLKALATIGGENSEYYNVNTSNIASIFNKIEISLGLKQDISMMGVTSQQGQAFLVKKEVNPYLQLSVKNFAVMFNLDVSGSMNGNKWSSVCASVSNFIGKLGNTDLVSGLVFNEEVKILTKISEDDKIFARPRSSSGMQPKTQNQQIQFTIKSNTNNEDCTIM